MNATATSRNPWPIAIIAFFLVLITCIGGFVTWAVRQKMDLVRKDYYEEEMRFQRHLEKVGRTTPILSGLQLVYDRTNGVVLVQLPAGHASQHPSGRIHFYRPSDQKLDRIIPLSLAGGGTQRIESKQFHAGFWKIRLSWTVSGNDYFFEQPVVIN